MPAPNSYTRENVVEIQAHGGAMILKNILDLILQYGARYAAPGEFTKRAFINGRIDLSQAEAIMDIISARSEKALKMATIQLKGALSEKIKEIINSLEYVYAVLEADIDFCEELEEPLNSKALWKKVEKDIVKPIKRMLESYDNHHFVREGLRLVILGRPNVGKSSLLNRFLNKERAIVTEFPGTTRDSIEESFNISGLPIIIVDTAGWHKTSDPVEKIGIARAKEFVNEADLILFIIEANQDIGFDDNAIYEQIKKKKAILVVNKIDLIKERKASKIPDSWKFNDIHYISVKYNIGVEDLKKGIYEFAVKNEAIKESSIVPNIRQKKLLNEARDAAIEGLEGLKACVSSELVAIDINEAKKKLKEILGENIKKDILENIFSQFCIGK